MDMTLATVAVEDLPELDRALRGWQVEGDPLQLHPGDVGWGCRRGVAVTAATLRVWRLGGRAVAVGFLDEPDLLRLGLAPDVGHDDDVAERLAADLADPGRGVLPAGEVFVEAPVGATVHEVLAARGWEEGEAWTALHRDLTTPVEDPGVRVEVVDADRARDWSCVHRTAFTNISALGDDEMHRRWTAMLETPAAEDSRSLVAYDGTGAAVAAVTVWSAGPGRPGLLEPMGVHRDHRGHGFGRAVTVAAARALQELGCSSATVCTTSANLAAVATYASAGYEPQPERHDRRRPA